MSSPGGGHRLADLDDSGVSCVALCECGRAFIAAGLDRVQDAQFERARHQFDMLSFAHQDRDNGGWFPIPPQREDYAA